MNAIATTSAPVVNNWQTDLDNGQAGLNENIRDYLEQNNQNIPVFDLSDDSVQVYNNIVDRLQSPNEDERNRSIEVLADLIANKQINLIMFLRLWHCLIECLKMSTVTDMPYTISNLMGVINNLNLIPFVKSFWTTIKKEWNNIDSHRIYKLYDMIRSFIRALLTRISRDGWNNLPISTMAESTLEDPDVPDGIKYHLCDVYVDEMTFVGNLVEWRIPIAQLLQPFQSPLTKSKNKNLIKKILEDVLEKILTVIPIGYGAFHIRAELTTIIQWMIAIVNNVDTSATCRNQAKIIAQKYIQTITEITDRLSIDTADINDTMEVDIPNGIASSSTSETPNGDRCRRSSKSISWGVNVTRVNYYTIYVIPEYVKDSTVSSNTLVTPSTPPRGILKRRHEEVEIHRMTRSTLMPVKKFREDKN
ncbi:10977_t:CDS:2 [Scutellospora calospora]|uniref:10977_t:CDS:1 n=1 Tax=Scutellospora calospora TaxID=85575 RepID=A0ACA9MBB4_9GLOM|nr:10977_t:CDS:2 [Scutellospora calospora]